MIRYQIGRLLTLMSLVAVDGHAATIQIAPHWAAGDRAEYVLVKGINESKGIQPAVSASTSTPVHIAIEKSGPDGFVVAWSYGDSTYDGRKATGFDAYGQLLKAQAVRLRLDPAGRVQEVLNWQEVRDKTDQVLLRIRTARIASGKSAASVDFGLAQTRQLLSTEAGVRNLCSREAQLMSIVWGRNLDDAHKIEEAASLPNELLGEAITAVDQFSVAKSDDAGRQLVVTWRREPNAAEVDRAYRNAAEQFARQAGKSMTLPPEAHLSFHEDARFVIDASTGWPSEVTYERVRRTSGVGESKETVETTRLERQRPAVP